MPDIARFEVWLVKLNPAQGREISKTRPFVVISPDEMTALSTVLVAPMTTKSFHFPGRVICEFQGKKGMLLLDRIRAVDKSRFVKKLGVMDEATQKESCKHLQELFAY